MTVIIKMNNLIQNIIKILNKNNLTVLKVKIIYKRKKNTNNQHLLQKLNKKMKMKKYLIRFNRHSFISKSGLKNKTFNKDTISICYLLTIREQIFC